MRKGVLRLIPAFFLASIFLALVFLTSSASPATDQQPPLPVCFWSDQGPLPATRPLPLTAAGLEQAEGLMTMLLAGPTSQEQAQGAWSAIPRGTALRGVEVQPGGAVTVLLEVPPEALHGLTHAAFEIIVEQIARTLEPLEWRDLRIQTWDPVAGEFVPLSSFLPDVHVPRKETVLSGEEEVGPSLAHAGQPPAPGQGQPQGALSGKTVYVSAGHGWQWNDSSWRTQRPVYQGFIEDHNNAEAVNQYLLQYLWNAGAQVWPVRERDMNAAEEIVNDDDGVGYAETGTWTTGGSSGYDPDVPGTYRWAETATGSPTASATWTATLPTDGRYAVYVWYRPGSNRAPDARYTVHHAGGETVVTIDQQHHGFTWHYIGSYGFHGGEVATVTLDNLSSQAGRVVVADAVRFGGGVFDDLTGIETTATEPPDKPWWEVATFYYAQRMGMNLPDNDVVARPLYARWEHAGSGDDAVYISWHTNGCVGTTRGTETYAHSSGGLPRTEGSLELRHAVHTELVHDIRAGWDPLWTDRGEKTKNLGELRLLWDEDENNRMPGALVEIAYHDNPDDAAALKEPAFQLLAARAIYQGIVKYFEQRDSIDLTLLPEPPAHLAVQNVGGGRVQIAWHPSPTDTTDLVGDAASGYRVYTSTDGLGWSDGVAVTGTTACTLTGLVQGQLLFVRVTATNDGGESFPTETLAARSPGAGGEAKVLLVNGFDRLNGSMLVLDQDPVEGDNLRMFLDRMNSYDYVVQHGMAITYPFDSASNEAVQDGLVGLDDYGVVDWVLGEESTSEETLNGTEQALLSSFLEGGGGLFISGAEIGWDLDYLGSSHDRAFYTTTLRAAYAGDDAGTYQVTPTVGSIFDGLGYFRFDASYDADYPDQLSAVSGSTPTLTYSGGLGGTAAVQYAEDAASCPRLVYFGFPFETIEASRRPAVMAQVMGFLMPCLPQYPSTRIETPAHLSAHNVAPPFAGTAAPGTGGAALERVEVQVQAPDGNYWDESNWQALPTWITATGTGVWSYTLPALGADGDYTLRARAWTTDAISDTSPAEAAFTYDTVSPTATSLITPTGGVTIAAIAGVALAWQPVTDTGSSLAYALDLDGQTYTTTQTAYTTTGYLAEKTYTWGVQVLDAAGNSSGWVTDTFAVRQYSSYLPLAARNLGGVETCTDVVANGGFEAEGGWVFNHLATTVTAPVHSGASGARVGIPPGEPNEYTYSSVMQQVALPAGSEATLRAWVYTIGGDSNDGNYVTLYDQFGTPHYLDSWPPDTMGWEQRAYDLTPYLGQAVTFYVGTKNNGSGDTALMYIDDVTLEVCP